MALCPECEAKLTLPEELEVGDVVVCRTCEAVLEVITLRPLELELVRYLDDTEEDEEEELEDFEDVELDWELDEEDEDENE